MNKIKILFLGLILAACSMESTSDLRIINGELVDPADQVAASTVSLIIDSNFTFCSGTLIGEQDVITAAHCLYQFPANRKLSVGFSTDNTKGNIVTRDVDFKVIHEKFDTAIMNGSYIMSAPNDIAYIHLATKAPTKPVRYMLSGELVQKGMPMILAGFGISDMKTKASGKLFKITLPVSDIDAPFKEIEFKAVEGKSACNGDSGGPAYATNKDGTLSLLGVTSRGSSNCNGYDIYTDVRYFMEWIEQKRSRK